MNDDQQPIGLASDGKLRYCIESDVWEGVHQGRDLQVAGDVFAAGLEVLAQSRFGLPWDELGEEEYISVLVEARHELAFWAAIPRY